MYTYLHAQCTVHAYSTCLWSRGVHLCSGGVGREQPPVDVAAVAQVWVVAVLCGQAEHTLNQLLRVRGTLEEELDDGRQQLQLDLGGGGGEEGGGRGRGSGRRREEGGGGIGRGRRREGGREGEGAREGERGGTELRDETYMYHNNSEVRSHNVYNIILYRYMCVPILHVHIVHVHVVYTCTCVHILNYSIKTTVYMYIYIYVYIYMYQYMHMCMYTCIPAHVSPPEGSHRESSPGRR